MSRRATGVPLDASRGPRRTLDAVLSIGMGIGNGHGPPSKDAPRYIDYRQQRRDVEVFLDWLHKTHRWHARPETINDIINYFTGGNQHWDDAGIQRLERKVQAFFSFLKCKGLISAADYANIESGGFRYLSEYASVAFKNALQRVNRAWP